MTSHFDLEEARKTLAEQRLNAAISQYGTAKDAGEDTEALENRLQEIEILLGFQSERPRAEALAWADIPEPEPREWLIDKWLPANTVTMFTGDGGAGKTWLTLQAVCQIVCGFREAYLNPDFKKIADRTAPNDVVFATWEDEPAEIKRRLLTLENGMPWIAESMGSIRQHLHIVDMRGIGSVWGPGIGKHVQNTGDLLAAGEDLRAICEDLEARLLVLDPLSGAFGGNENDRTGVYDFVSSFRGWGDTARCAMLVIGHLPKSIDGRNAGYSGSTAWEASARAMWRLSTQEFKQGEGKDEITRHYWRLEHTKSNYAPLQPPIYLSKDKKGWWIQVANPTDAADAYEAYHGSIQTNQPAPAIRGDNNGEAELPDDPVAAAFMR